MHTFSGLPITTEEFEHLAPRSVFSREIDRKVLDTASHRDRHILFRRRFILKDLPQNATLYLSADDHYKLYVNGNFVCEGPAPAYHSAQEYNTVDITPYLTDGENLLAVHTYYQGLVNRVWQSGDNRHFFLCDLVCDGVTAVKSDESFLSAYHTAYQAIGTVGYDTGFRTRFDARAPEVGFEAPDYDDSAWQNARIARQFDESLVEEKTQALVYERISPICQKKDQNTIFLDFGKLYAGSLSLTVRGSAGDKVKIRMGQELCPDGSIRYQLRANCHYEEELILKEGDTFYQPYDYFAFRYAEICLPEGATLLNASLIARHYPFSLKATLKPAYQQDKRAEAIWQLCLHTQKYGMQEAPLDCLEREKGFYLGDGCYSALTHMILTGDDTMVKKLIDSAFASAFITDTLMCCLRASFMQEIAEFPLILVKLVGWHYALTDDRDYLLKNFPKVAALLDAYRRNYEKDFLLSELDKWCVVEWPSNFRDGYDVDLTSGKVCHEPHAVMNAYYIDAIRAANHMAKALGKSPYREEAPLVAAYQRAFFRPKTHFFCDSTKSEHSSFLSNLFAYAFSLCPDEESSKRIYQSILSKKISSVSLFGAFVMLEGLCRQNRPDAVRAMLFDENAWLSMLAEGATTTFESWSANSKWNTSLFHITLSYAAIFLADIDLEKLFSGESF